MSQNNPFILSCLQHKLILIGTALNINTIDKDMFLNKETFELGPKSNKKVVDLCDFPFEAESFQIILDDVVDLITLK